MTADTVEGLRDADIAIVARIHAACFYDAWGPNIVRQVLEMPGTFGLAACWGGRGATIGFALARVVAEKCELLSLGVAPDHRARGVGARLLVATMTRATAAHAIHFFLEVAEDNEPALRLYRAHGLVSVGRRPQYYETECGDRTAALTMRCQLPSLSMAP